MKHIIFDFDGTLVDSFPLVAEVARQVLPQFDLSDKELQKLRNMPPREVIKYSGLPYWKIARLVIKGRKLLTKRLDELEAFPELPDIIRTLSTSGHQLSVVSSNSEEIIRAVLKRQKLEKYFDGVYGGVGLFNKARVFKVVRRDQKTHNNDMIYVGDEVRDIEAAKKSGIPIIAVTWGYSGRQILTKNKPDHLVDKPAQLLKILVA